MSGAAVVALVYLQAAVCLLLGCQRMLRFPLSERAVAGLLSWLFSLCFGLALWAGLGLAKTGPVTIPVGRWHLSGGFDFLLSLHLDWLSLPFLLLGTALCGVVAAFSERYLHREPGYHRFFFTLCLFGLGYTLTILGGSIEVLYASWEFLGLSSAMLIGFFHDRPAPVRNGLYAFAVYRICDLGLVLASVLVFQQFHSGELEVWLGRGQWPNIETPLTPAMAGLIGGLLLLSAAGKSGQWPFCGWLPRAMEGPTPSTAIFYGALSVHAGAYLLLRCSPLLDASPAFAAAATLIGLGTALTARLVGRVQNDIKCRLAYSSLAQVGLIFAEIGLGFRWLPVLHVLGHAALRSVQFLKAPSLLHEIHELHSALGEYHLAPTSSQPSWSYRFGLERGYLDTLIGALVLRPALGLGKALRSADRQVLKWLVGPPPS